MHSSGNMGGIIIKILSYHPSDFPMPVSSLAYKFKIGSQNKISAYFFIGKLKLVSVKPDIIARTFHAISLCGFVKNRSTPVFRFAYVSTVLKNSDRCLLREPDLDY